MKKRSLFAAVAMLIVSAVVLTSATYAWFQSNAAVTMPALSATTESQAGGLLVAAKNQDGWWKNNLTWENDYSQATGNVNSSTFVPVAGTVANDGSVSFLSGSLAGTDFIFSNSEAQSGFIRFVTFVQSPSVDGTIEVKPTLDKKTGSNDNLAQFVYFAATVEPQTSGDTMTAKSYFANATTANRGYNAITGGDETTSSIKYEDTNRNGVINDNEWSKTVDSTTITLTHSAMTSANASFSQANANTALQFAAKAGNVYKVTVYVWAEGQDEACVAGAAASSAEVQLKMNLKNS